MTITKRQLNPSAYALTIRGRSFWFTFETMSNTTSGQPRRLVRVIHHKKGRATYYARSYIIKLSYQTEEEAAHELAQMIAQECER